MCHRIHFVSGHLLLRAGEKVLRFPEPFGNRAFVFCALLLIAVAIHHAGGLIQTAKCVFNVLIGRRRAARLISRRLRFALPLPSVLCRRTLLLRLPSSASRLALPLRLPLRTALLLRTLLLRTLLRGLCFRSVRARLPLVVFCQLFHLA